MGQTRPRKDLANPQLKSLELAEGDLVSLDFPEPVDLRDFVSTIAYWTNKNVILDTKVVGKIQIVGPRKVTKAEAYEAFLSALDTMNLSVLETGQIIRIQPKREVSVGGGPQLIDSKRVVYSDRVFTQIFPLKFLTADVVRNVLANIVSATIFTSPSTNSVIMTDTGFNLRKVSEFLAIVDHASFHANYEFIRLKHAPASEAAKMMNDLFKNDPLVGGEKFKFVLDEPNNSLVILGPPASMKRARDFLTAYDKPLSNPNGHVQGGIYVRPLMFADAKKLASILNSISPNQARASTKAAEKFDITADEATNSILFKGPVEAFRSMNGIIRKLDEAKDQVFLEFNILAISESNNFSFLPSLLGGAGKSDGTGTQTIVGYEAAAMTPLIMAQANPSGGAQNATLMTNAFQNDLTLGVFPGATVNIPGIGKITPGALLRIMKNDSYGRTLHSPQILTLDNEEANFTVGQTYWYETSKLDPQGVLTKSPQKENVDLTVKVKPTMSGSSYLNLQVEIDSNSVQGFTPEGIPQIAKRKARQLVNLKNGQTILISGIQNLSRSKTEKSVPFIGSIPLIGYLFSSKAIENTMEYVLIFMTAHTVRGAEDLHAIYEKRVKDQDPSNAQAVLKYFDKE